MQASILHNSNRIVSSSEDSWGSMRENTLIRFKEDINFYTIGSIKKFLYIKNFNKVNHNIIKIEDDINIDLVENDCISLSYKEYELLTVSSLVNKGFGYKIADSLLLEGGVPIKDVITGKILNARLVVSRIDENGCIEQLRLENPGRYLQLPKEECNLIGGCGVRACVKVDFKIIDSRTIFEKTIVKIDKQIGYNEIQLDSSLIDGVSNGKISVNKWEALLTSNYIGETKINQEIELVRDFTPFLRMPFLSHGNNSPEVVYNLALSLVDKKFKDLQTQIDKLESRLSIVSK